MCDSKLFGLYPFDNIAIIHWVKNNTWRPAFYKLTPEEKHAWYFSLDDDITKQNDIKIKTEFESLYYQILKYTNQLDQGRQDELKSKICRTCENYSWVNVLYKYQKIIDNIFLKQRYHSN